MFKKKKKKKVSPACQAVRTLETASVAVDTVTTRALHTSAAFWGRWPRELQQDGSPFTEGGGMDGGVKGGIFTSPLSKQSVSCVFPLYWSQC